MQNDPSTLVIVGGHTLRGMGWLEDRFPTASWQGRALILRRPGGELDAVLWAESLRQEAQAAGVRLSIGVAELAPGVGPRVTANAAGRAYRRAFELGGDMTVAHSNLLRAA